MKREKSKRTKAINPKTKKTEIKQDIIVKNTFFDKLPNSKIALILAGLICAIGLVAFFHYLTTEYLFYFKDIGSDSINQNYPGSVHQVNMWKDTFFTRWSFYRGMGDRYIMILPPDPYSLFRIVLNKFGVGVFGVNFLVNGRFFQTFFFNIFLTGIIFFFYLRTLSIKNYTAIIGALLITFSGFVIVGSSWGFAGHVFKAAFLLLAFEQLYLKNRWYFFPFAVIFLSGNVFVLYIYSVFLLLYSIFRYLADNGKNLGGYLKLAGKMIMWGAVGLIMNIPTIVVSFRKLYFSPRVSGNVSYAEELSAGQEIVEHANLGATTILRTFSSDILGTGSQFKGWYNYLEAPLFYIGLLTLLILPQVFIYLNKRNRIIFAGFLGFWLLTLFFPILRYTVLAYTGDYFRYGFDFFIPFTFLFYAIYALNEMDKGFKINYKLLGATLVFLLVLLFFPYQSIRMSIIDNQIRLVLVMFLFLYTLLLILFSMPKYRNYAQIGLLLVVFAELSYSAYKSYEKRIPVTKKEFQADRAGYADGTPEAVKYITKTDKSLFFRIEKDYSSGEAQHSSLNDAMAQGYYGTARYSSFNQPNYIRFLEETNVIEIGNETATRWNHGLRGYPLLQTFGNVKYHLSKADDPVFKRVGFDSIAMVDSVKILKNMYSLPFGYAYDKYLGFSQYQQLSPFNKQIALLNGFVYEEDEFTYFKPEGFQQINTGDSLVFVDEQGFNFRLYQQFTDSLRKDTLAISSFKQDNIKGSITLKEPKLLFFTIPFNPGWRIKVNGKNEKLSRVNIGFTGIKLPAGTHQLELYFIPEYHQLTTAISWVSVALFWLYLGYYLVWKRKKHSN